MAALALALLAPSAAILAASPSAGPLAGLTEGRPWFPSKPLRYLPGGPERTLVPRAVVPEPFASVGNGTPDTPPGDGQCEESRPSWDTLSAEDTDNGRSAPASAASGWVSGRSGPPQTEFSDVESGAAPGLQVTRRKRTARGKASSLRSRKPPACEGPNRHSPPGSPRPARIKRTA
ncbi:MAG: hypothetical protein M3358_12670 [Actinomycetota bacterium]|jgi:hypothetical protein|nr:hypothetical protein [Actinomycetota bacterium]